MILILCFFIAWMITNGWSYIFIAIGSLKDIEWMLDVGLAYQAFLWLPITPEKLVTIPIAMWLNLKVFKDAKTAAALAALKKKAFEEYLCIRMYICLRMYVRMMPKRTRARMK